MMRKRLNNQGKKKTLDQRSEWGRLEVKRQPRRDNKINNRHFQSRELQLLHSLKQRKIILLEVDLLRMILSL
jgi:hypothetical protein